MHNIRHVDDLYKEVAQNAKTQFENTKTQFENKTFLYFTNVMPVAKY